MIVETDLPQGALLQRYANAPNFTDCYGTGVPGDVSCARYVEAFYTAPLFRCERLILGAFAGRPSTDIGAKAVARGTSETFAAWDVEARAEHQLMLCDMAAATRSWFMVQPNGTSTTLYFGSAVTPKDGKELGPIFRTLLPAHALYSKLLLAGARKRLINQDQY